MPPQPLHDPVDAVAGQPEDRVDLPVDQPFRERVGCDLCHRCLRSRFRGPLSSSGKAKPVSSGEAQTYAAADGKAATASRALS